MREEVWENRVSMSARSKGMRALLPGPTPRERQLQNISHMKLMQLDFISLIVLFVLIDLI